MLRPLLALLVACTAALADPPTQPPPPPVIPAGFTLVNITDYGAVGDGRTINTAAFAKAVAVCDSLHGGTIIVPPGTYLTGPIQLHSHIELRVEKGATIKATGKFSDYGLPDPLPATQEALNALRPALKPLISGSHLTDVAIRGKGVIDGSGAPWWAKSDRAVRLSGTGTYVPRPCLIILQDCTRVEVSGVTLSNSPMFHLVPKRCTDVLIDGVKIHAPADSPNTDAIDPSNCRNVLIRHVVADIGDDNIGFKANSDGPCQDITVTDCTFLHGHGVSIGSETDGGVRNILVKNCTFQGTGTAIRIKTSRARGGVVENITYRDITMKDVDQAIYINCFYEDKPGAENPRPMPVTAETPFIRNILISNVTCENAKAAGQITGLPESAASGITLENVRVTAWTGFDIQDAQGLTFRNVSFTTSPKPPEAGTPAGESAFPTPPTSFPVPLPPALKAKLLSGWVIVAADGTGDFQTVQDAVNAAPDEPQTSRPFVIHIRPGIYREVVTVPPQKGAVTFEGEDAATTIITAAHTALNLGPDGKPIGTFRSATVFIQGDDFTASNITFENTAGNHGQALAINIGGDRATFRKCRFLGWQDTILVLQRRQYFEDCYVDGVTDFIFGAATAFFERCHIHCLASGYITAASTPQSHPFGFVFDHCTITAEPGVHTWLGRPWRPYSSVTFLAAALPSAINPQGWVNWNAASASTTARYGEWKSTGPGASPATRVPWSRQLTDAEAAAISVDSVLGDWKPAVNPGR